MIKSIESLASDNPKYLPPKALQVLKKHWLRYQVTDQCNFSECVEELKDTVPQLVIHKYAPNHNDTCQKCVNLRHCRNIAICSQIDWVMRMFLEASPDAGRYNILVYYRR